MYSSDYSSALLLSLLVSALSASHTANICLSCVYTPQHVLYEYFIYFRVTLLPSHPAPSTLPVRTSYSSFVSFPGIHHTDFAQSCIYKKCNGENAAVHITYVHPGLSMSLVTALSGRPKHQKIEQYPQIGQYLYPHSPIPSSLPFSPTSKDYSTRNTTLILHLKYPFLSPLYPPLPAHSIQWLTIAPDTSTLRLDDTKGLYPSLTPPPIYPTLD